MHEREVVRSTSTGTDDEQRDGTLWRRLVDRLVDEGEPFANAVRIADRILRQGHHVEVTTSDGSGEKRDPQTSDS